MKFEKQVWVTARTIMINAALFQRLVYFGSIPSPAQTLNYRALLLRHGVDLPMAYVLSSSATTRKIRIRL
ncbi:MAG: hypothetical protein AAF546_06035 [Verrucomicrobiota bacterium]